MSGQLFAFRVSKPVVEPTTEEPLTFTYDPQSQTAVWQGDARALTLATCTRMSLPGPRYCNAYGSNYCNTGGGRVANGKKCDYI